MHTDLSPQLHSDGCNELIQKLAKCHSERPIAKLYGACNDIDRELNRCLKKERIARRERNAEHVMKVKRERFKEYGK